MLYTKNVNLTDTSTQTIVTVPNGYVAHWNMLFVTNLHNATNNVIVFIVIYLLIIIPITDTVHIYSSVKYGCCVFMPYYKHETKR